MTSIPFFVSLIPIIILHVLNILRLRKGLSQSNVHVSKTMSMILAAIIIIFLVANSPVIIFNILFLCDIQTQLLWLGQNFWMLSYCSNPFFMFFTQRQPEQLSQTHQNARCSSGLRTDACLFKKNVKMVAYSSSIIIDNSLSIALKYVVNIIGQQHIILEITML